MIQTNVHYRGNGCQSIQLPVIPSSGDYIENAGALYMVDATVHDGATVHLYAIRASEPLADELRTAWSDWDAPPTAAEITTEEPLILF